MCRHLLVASLASIVCLLAPASSSGDDVMTSSNDLDLIKLYLEEFRLELMSVKSQLVRMARNSKLLRTTLKELRSSKCGHSSDALDYASVECPLGFRLSSPASCYKFVRERVTWGDAQRRCSAHNGHLLALESQTEQRFINNHLKHTRKLQNCDYWTAGSDQLEEGVWTWNVTGGAGGKSRDVPVTSHNWNIGEPNNSNGDENCLLLDWYADWRWNDASCRRHRACYICEIDM